MASIRAVVFDSDGTLFNTFELINEAYNHVARTHGLQPPTAEQVLEKLRLSVPLPEILATFFPGYEVTTLLETNNAFFAENALKISGFEGLHSLLDELVDQGLKLAILTAGDHKIHDILASYGLEHHFSSVVHCNRIQNHKPHPEGFLLAMQECGVAATEAVMVGDSLVDIAAGQAAGALATIGITHGNGTYDDLQRAGADYIVGSLPEIAPIIERMYKESVA
jgi:HAD superfamily hydrolase (TIGR01549 family)